MVQTRVDPEKGCLKHKQQPKHGIRPFVFEVAPAERDVYDLISVEPDVFSIWWFQIGSVFSSKLGR